jgi:hypothetical protein
LTVRTIAFVARLDSLRLVLELGWKLDWATYLVCGNTLSSTRAGALPNNRLSSSCSRTAVARALLGFLAVLRNLEVTDRRHLRFSSTVVLRQLILLGFFHCFCGSSSFGLSGRFRKELFEVFEKIRGSVEKSSNLCVNVLNGLGFALVGLKNFEKLFVDFWSVLETILGERRGQLICSGKKNIVGIVGCVALW